MWKRCSGRWFLNHLLRDSKCASVESNTSAKEMLKLLNLNYSCRRLIVTCVNTKYGQLNEEQYNGCKWKQLRKYSEGSGATSLQSTSKDSPYKTEETDPRNHDERHLGRIYTIPGMLLKFTLIFGSAINRRPKY